MTRTSRARIASPERYWLAEGILQDDRAGEEDATGVPENRWAGDTSRPYLTTEENN